RSDVRPDKPNIDRFALPEFLVVKLALSIFELANHGLNRLAQGGILAIRPINAPLMSLGIVHAQSQTFDVTGWAIGLEFLKIGTTVPNFSSDRSAVKFDPGRGANQGVLKAR